MDDEMKQATDVILKAMHGMINTQHGRQQHARRTAAVLKLAGWQALKGYCQTALTRPPGLDRFDAQALMDFASNEFDEILSQHKSGNAQARQRAAEFCAIIQLLADYEIAVTPMGSPADPATTPFAALLCGWVMACGALAGPGATEQEVADFSMLVGKSSVNLFA